MFDVSLANGEEYRESETYRAGNRAVIAQTPWGKLGMTICYDVRFSGLFNDLASAGATVIAVPSAFTWLTGSAHWEVLLRARAIETGCWILAAAQCGKHAGGRQTYGHSLIVNPWGKIIAQAGNYPEIIYGDIDQQQVLDARNAIPSLTSRRRFNSAKPVNLEDE